jgi:nucleoside-diphosphate-sugar epimerase
MIAITGANGLLGSYIVRKLVVQNEKFVALKRKGSDLSLLKDIKESITWREADILDSVSMEEALEGVTHVIHAAAMVSFNPRSRDQIYNVNVQGTKNTVNACLATGVKKLVHISSVAALGRLKGQTSIDERHNWVDNSLNSTYAETKYLAELEVFRAHEEGLNTVILNPSVILAAADWKKSSAKLFKYVWDERPFYIDSQLNYVDVRDVANAVHQLLHAHYPGERFILNAGNITLHDFFSQIADRFKKRPPGIKLSTPLVKVIAFLERYRSRMVGAEPLITSETARLANTRFLYQNEKIKNTLNFKFEAFDKTLDWCCQYYMNCQNAKK